MKKSITRLAILCCLMLPVFGWSQTDTTAQKKDTVTKMAVDSAAVKKDTAVAVVDTAKPAAKDCYQKWYEVMRARGAKPVTDGMQQVVIALKGPDGVNCMMGQIEVAGGKMKPPLFVQQENGEYRALNTIGKKLDPAFATAMGEDQLFAISEGMSIVFLTSDKEYGRLFFYKFANKAAQGNKPAPSPDELIKD
jgi:hypothetical protein